MDETRGDFQLLSSMSPKVVKNVKKKKAPTKLALKRSVRRSTIFDKLPITKKNKDVSVIDIPSTESSSKNSHEPIPRQSVIVLDSDEEQIPIVQSNDLLSVTKFNSIQNWIADINKAEIKDDFDISTLSQISSIQGECKKQQYGVSNSTFINGKKPVCFDDMFKKRQANCEESFYDAKEIIDETFLINDSENVDKISKGSSSSTKRSGGSFKSKNTCDKKKEKESNENSKEIIIENNEFKTPVIPKKTFDFSAKKKTDKTGDNINKSEENNKENIDKNNLLEFKTPSKQSVLDEDTESLLDELYGKQWRANKDKILSEPRLKPKNAVKNLPAAPKTELKPKKSITYKNPYLDSERNKSKNLFQIIQSTRINAATTETWKAKLESLCDPDSDDSRKDTEFVKPSYNVPVKLQFDDCNDSDSNYRSLKSSTSSYISTKSNSLSDFSDNLNDFKLKKTCTPTVTKKVTVEGNKKPKTPNLKNLKTIKPITPVLKKLEDDFILEDKFKKKLVISDYSHSSSDDSSIKQLPLKPQKGPLSFLASLSNNVNVQHCDASAKVFKTCYKKYRAELLQKLFKLYNEKIFDKCIPADTLFEWSDRMTGTAGTCHCKKLVRRTGEIERSVRFVLSTKVLDSADRLRDTLVHEMCHAATWLVNKVPDGHGPFWKSWAAKAMKVFPELPPIKRCHDYEINTKYTYKCTECGYSFGRHSKTLNLERKRCGKCYGKFALLINKKNKNGETKSIPATPKKEPTGFALFVKQNYANCKLPQLQHKDVMKILSKKYQELKVVEKK